MSKDLIVLCDGTAASPEGQPDNPTNIRIFNQILGQAQPVAESNNEEGWELRNIYNAQGALERQVYYHRGLGALVPEVDPKNLSWGEWLASFAKPAERALSAIAAVGIMKQVKELYYFLAKHYEKGDRIYLFGFSRGAYALRILITFIRHIGLIDKQKFPSDADLKKAIEEGFALYSKDIHPDDNQAVKDFRDKNSHPYAKSVYFLGLFDTVPGYVVESVRNDPQLTSVVKIARHATAVDEKRPFFKPILWCPVSSKNKSYHQDSLQMWFTGDHCDIGGFSSDEEGRALPNITLIWMLEEVMKYGGLTIDPAALAIYRDNTSALGLQHDSLFDPVLPGAGITWEKFGLYQRPIDETTFDEDVHSSVFERYGKEVPVQRRGCCKEESYKPNSLTKMLTAYENLSRHHSLIPRPETVSASVPNQTKDDWVTVTGKP